jgi:hypothetical protein
VSEDTPGDADRILRRTLDVIVFAPVGMAVTLAEELPEFVDKGRRRVQIQLGNARIVGHFVVTRGQRQLSERLDEVLHGMNNDVADAEASERGQEASVERGGGGRDRGRKPSQRPTPTNDLLPPPSDPAAVAILEGALADYDTLSASQVVRRLASLGPDELLAVQRYEASTRNRRTILNRATQLLEEGPAAAAGE